MAILGIGRRSKEEKRKAILADGKPEVMASLTEGEIEKLATEKLDRKGIARLVNQYKIPISAGDTDLDPDSDAWMYRSLGTYGKMAALDRRLSDIEQEQIQRVGHWLWVTDPIIGGAVEMIVDCVIGSGFQIESKHEDVLAELNVHWDNPRNNWEIYQRDRLRDLVIFGEQFYPAVKGEGTGRLTIAYLDPYQVKGVITDPDDVSYAQAVVRKDQQGKGEQKYEIIHPGEKMLDGEMFYFSLNRCMASSRGFSPLLRVADWSGVYDRLAFMLAENQAVADEHIKDIELEGATQEDCDKWTAKQNQARGAGGWFVHNQNVKLDYKFANLKAADRTAIAKLVMSFILAGIRLPEFWVTGQAENINRASALAQGDPTEKALKALQGYFVNAVTLILTYDLRSVRATSDSAFKDLSNEEFEQGLRDGTLFQVLPPPINIPNEKEIAETAKVWADACMIAEMQGWIDKQEAAQTFAHAASRIGREVEISEDLQKQEPGETVSKEVEETVRKLVKAGVEI